MHKSSPINILFVSSPVLVSPGNVLSFRDDDKLAVNIYTANMAICPHCPNVVIQQVVLHIKQRV